MIPNTTVCVDELAIDDVFEWDRKQFRLVGPGHEHWDLFNSHGIPTECLSDRSGGGKYFGNTKVSVTFLYGPSASAPEPYSPQTKRHYPEYVWKIMNTVGMDRLDEKVTEYINEMIWEDYELVHVYARDKGQTAEILMMKYTT